MSIENFYQYCNSWLWLLGILWAKTKHCFYCSASQNSYLYIDL